MPDHRSEITRVWLASKLRMDAFPRTERLIYERTLKRDLDFASQWHAPQPPSSKVVAFASFVKICVLGLGGVGHMAIKLAVGMKCHAVVLSRSKSKEALASALHAEFVDSNDRDAAL